MVSESFILKRLLVAFLVVQTRADGEIRLVNGNDEFEGRVEIWYNGEWGTICDDGWDIRDAHVVCRQLGLGYAVSASDKAFFGRGTNPIAMDEINCVGDEERLDQCPFRGWLLHNCLHQEDAGVQCSADDGGLRLVGGKTLNEGRTEIFYGGEWGTICDDGWDINEATVVCRKLGLGNPVAVVGDAFYGEGTGEPIMLANVECEGTENGLHECDHKGWQVHTCDHTEDAGVQCAKQDISSSHEVCNNYDVRLVNGPSESDGIVEVCYKGFWGTVCAESWGNEEASSVCQQLGYRDLDHVYARTGAIHSSEQIVEYLSCKENETPLLNCDITFKKPMNCVTSAGVSCLRKDTGPTADYKECTKGRARLVNGSNYYEGLVQICVGELWTDICTSSWGNTESLILCRQLGYADTVAFYFSDTPRYSDEESTAGSLTCSGEETDLSMCSFFFTSRCDHPVNVLCKDADTSVSFWDSIVVWRIISLLELIVVVVSFIRCGYRCWKES